MESSLKRKAAYVPNRSEWKKVKTGPLFEGLARARAEKIKDGGNENERKSMEALKNTKRCYSEPCLLKAKFRGVRNLSSRIDSDVIVESSVVKRGAVKVAEQFKTYFPPFKARPVPEYKAPMRPMKSLKKLTVPIEPALHTDRRAQLRQHSLDVQNDL